MRFFHGLRFQLVAIVLTVVLCLAAVGAALLNAQLESSYRQIERQQALDNVQRVMRGFEAQLDQMTQVMHEYSQWSELYAYINDRNAAFRQDVLTPLTVSSSRMAWLILLDQRGALIHAIAGAPADQAKQQPLVDAVLALWPVHTAGDEDDWPCGLAEVLGQLQLICRQTVSDSVGTAPVNGSIIMLRPFTPQMRLRMQQNTGVDFSVVKQTPQLPGQPAASRWITSPQLGSALAVVHEGNTHQLSLWPIRQLGGALGPHIQVVDTREVFAQGKAVLRQVQTYLLWIAVVAALLLFVAVDKLVVRRLLRMGKQLQHIETERAWSERLSEQGQDEIGVFARHANKLLEEIQSQIQRLERSATTDALTGLRNRRFFDEALTRLVSQHGRSAQPLCLVIADLDEFKAYNDHYGHQAGDAALRAVAEVLSSACRRVEDVAARLGGEEFALLLPNSDLAATLTVLEQARQALRARAVAHAGSSGQGVLTFSAGVALLAARETAGSLYRRADQALYQAKAAGRDQARASHEEPITLR